MFTSILTRIALHSLAAPIQPPMLMVYGPAPIVSIAGPYRVVVETDYPHYCQIIGPGVGGIWPCEFAEYGRDLANLVWSATPERRLDFNGDGMVDSSDYYAYLTAFLSQAPNDAKP